MARNESDAAALQAKLAAKKAAKEAQGDDDAAVSSAPVVPKKKAPVKNTNDMDDLLSAGLSTGKKRSK
jgi:hypothetical protein